jgi:hypothetical protein
MWHAPLSHLLHAKESVISIALYISLRLHLAHLQLVIHCPFKLRENHTKPAQNFAGNNKVKISQTTIAAYNVWAYVVEQPSLLLVAGQ